MSSRSLTQDAGRRARVRLADQLMNAHGQADENQSYSDKNEPGLEELSLDLVHGVILLQGYDPSA